MQRCLVALLAAAAGSLPALVAAFEEPIPEPRNRCEYSRLVLTRGGAPALAAANAAAADGDASTAFALAADGSQALEFHFIGAPRWLNRVEASTDATAFEVEILDLERVWRPYVRAGSAEIAGPRATLSGPDVYVRALRFVPRPTAGAATPGTARLFEIGAYFDAKDPDAERLGPAADGLNYHADWCNVYPGANNDLSKCDNDANAVADDLPGTWDKWIHGDANALEDHFKRVDLGGTNPDHVDNADLGYFAGHGTSSTDSYYGAKKRVLFFGNQSNDDCCLVPSDARHSWGNGDLEWVALSNCQTLKNADEWYHAMQGLHLILGWKTNMKDVNLGNYFGGYMVDKGAHDSAKKIKSSWWDAAEVTHGWDYTAYIVGETSSMGNDYLHGEGSVGADPTHNGSYHWWSYETCAFPCLASQGAESGAASPGGPGTAPALARGPASFATQGAASLEAMGPAPAPRDPVVFPKKSAHGFPVVIDRPLLAGAVAATMPVYDVVPVVVDSPYVRNIANHICQTEGVLCGGDIGVGDPGSVNLIDGLSELRVCQNTGAIHYEDTGNWLAWRTTPPSLLSGSSAVSRAEQILTAWNRRPPDARIARVDRILQGGRLGPESGTPADIPESTFATAIRVDYARQLGGSMGPPVVGPGASMTVAIGQGGAVQRVFQGGWRTLVQGPTVSVVPVQDAIDLLAAAGGDATVDGINPIVQQLQVDSWQLGYYEYDCQTPQSSVRPVYIFNCTITESPSGETPPVTSQDQIRVWAEALPPQGTIVAPEEGDCIAPGGRVCLKGIGAGGVSPLTLEWSDSQQGPLGTGDEICVTLDPPPPGHGSADSTHTVQLTVRDALGHEGHANVTICLSSTVDVPAPAPGGTLLVRTVFPNPSLGSARIAYEVPGGGAYRLEIFDGAGRRVARVVDGPLGPGPHAVEWNGRDEGGRVAPSGVYFARLSGAGATAGLQFTLSR